MNILYVASRNPWRLKAGREAMILQSLQTLAENGSVDLIYFDVKCSNKLDQSVVASAKAIGVNCIGSIQPRNIISSITRSMLRSTPIQLEMYSPKAALEGIRRSINDNSYDCIFFDMLRTSACSSVVPRGTYRVLEMDDLLSRRYARQVKFSNSRQINLLGTQTDQYRGGWLKFFSAYLGKFIVRRESRLMRALEDISPTNFDLVTLTSPLEMADLKGRSSADNVISFPPSFKKSQIYCNVDNKDCKGRIIVGFFGNMLAAHNKASLDYILTSVLSGVDRFRDIHFEFWVFGQGDVSYITKKHSNENLTIKALGPVDDLASVFGNINVMLCPILFGSGIKLKILDSLRFGVPVVTNSIGAEGIPYTNGLDMEVVDDPREMLNRVVSIGLDPMLNLRMREAGRQLLLSNFSYEINSDLLMSKLAAK